MFDKIIVEDEQDGDDTLKVFPLEYSCYEWCTEPVKAEATIRYNGTIFH